MGPAAFKKFIANTLSGGITQHQIAEPCGVSEGTVYRWSIGTACPIECFRDAVVMIVNHLGVNNVVAFKPPPTEQKE